MQVSLFLRFILLGIFCFVFVDCAPYYQENKYGNGRNANSSDSSSTIDSQNETPIDYQSYQANFMTISVSLLTYNVTQNLSTLKVSGNCFNPGFQITSIYYKATDQQGEEIASDGYPYLSNEIFKKGTNLLQPNAIFCNSNGTWSTNLQLPTAILYQLNKGYLRFSLVAWLKDQELHNDSTGVTSIEIKAPELQDGAVTDPNLTQ